MKLFFVFTVLVVLISCQMDKKTGIPAEFESSTQLFRSDSTSFQKDFYLEMEEDSVTVYGWFSSEGNDTIYYRSKCEIERDTSERITFRLENYDRSLSKVDIEHLEDFTPSPDSMFLSKEGLPFVIFHSSFMGVLTDDNKLECIAVKDIYWGRGDEFVFERVN